MSEVRVPDIGDFQDVPIIEIHVSPGDEVAVEDPLVTLESDKATMDVPAPFGGTVKELKVKEGDTVSEGSMLLTLETEESDDDADEAESKSSEERQADDPEDEEKAEAVSAAEEAECISDVRGSAAYKRELLRVYIGRVVRQALDEQARNSNGARH